MKDHEIAALVNDLTSIAREFGQTQQLRERISQRVASALATTQGDLERRVTQLESRTLPLMLIGSPAPAVAPPSFVYPTTICTAPVT
jgi:hypothetical protein